MGGFALRYDERFHVEVEAGGGTVLARAVIGGLRQEWSIPFDGGRLELHIDSLPPGLSPVPTEQLLGDEIGAGLPRTGDVIHLGATIDGERVQLAEVDGRFLSSEMTESFTGRVYGPYAVSGTVAVDRFSAEGDDE